MLRTLLVIVPVGAALVGAGAGLGATLATGSSGMGMGMSTTISRKAFMGYYDGHKDTYLNTDVSDKAQAKAMHVNYAPVLKSVPLATAPEIYLVEGNAAAGQLAVFGSEPGEATYSPVWKETMLMWKAGTTPVLITSDTQIDKLEKQGVLTEKATAIRLNCPIVKVGKSV
jgi:hypothetical protein